MKMKKILANLNNAGSVTISIEDCSTAVAINNDDNRNRVHVETQQKNLTDQINILEELKDDRADDEFYIVPEPIQSISVVTWINQKSDRVGFIVPQTPISDNVEIDVIDGANILCDLIGFPRIEGLKEGKDRFHNLVHGVFRQQGHFINVSGHMKYFEKDKDNEVYKLYLKNPLMFITRRFAESLGKKRALFTEEQLKKFQSKEALYSKLLDDPQEMLRYIDKKYVIEDSVNMLRVMLELEIGGKLQEYGTYGLRQYTSTYPFLRNQIKLVESISEALFPRWRTRHGSAEEAIERNQEAYDKVEKKLKSEYKITLKELFNNRLPLSKCSRTINLLQQNSILSDYRFECEVY